MNALPIILRELIVRARLPQMHWLRVVFTGIGVLLSLQYFLVWVSMGLAQVGGYAFQTLAWMGFLAANAGFLLTADSVSSERREGTLGLLLLTRVGVVDVLAGKLASAGLGALLGLVAITPVMMLPVLAGGVRSTQVVLTALSLPGLLFCSLCIGLWASSRSGQMGQAVIRAFLCLGAIICVPLIFSGLQATAGATELSRWVRGVSPAAAFLSGSRAMAAFTDPAYWMSVVAGFVFGGILLLMAAHELRLNWREDSEPESVRFAAQIRRLSPVSDEHPLRWLLRRSKRQALVIWLGVAFLLLPRLLNYGLGMLGFSGVGFSVAFNLATLVGAWFLWSYAGAMFFLEGRRTGSLELLRTTPEGVHRGVTDQWEVLRGRVLVPIALYVAVGFLAEVLFWHRLSGLNLLMQLPRALVGVAGTVFDVVALCWLGMWFGYRSPTTWSALLWPVGLVGGLDLVLTYIFYGVYAVFARTSFGQRGPGAVFLVIYLIAPGAITIAKQVLLIRWAKRRLRETLTGAPLEPLELRQQILLSVRQVRSAVEKARRWTPGGGTIQQSTSNAQQPTSDVEQPNLNVERPRRRGAGNR